jgi:hypothetical protein
MTTWLEANRLANLAAAQAHGDFGIDTSSPPIDVYGAIGDAGVVLMWRTMPRQFGAYVAESGSRPGILINNGLPPAAQRQTAGHELGHHRFGHGTRLDADLEAPLARRAVWTPEEKEAEAFAAWFLMPRKAVRTALARLGLEKPQEPEDVYQLSLLLGTPYLSTVRHLPSLRLASPNLASRWAATSPSVIKTRLDPTAEAPPSRRPDVWLISNRLAGAEVTVHAGDRLVIRCRSGGQILTYPSWLMDLPARASSSRRPRVGRGRGDTSDTGGGLVVMEVLGDVVGERAQVTIAAPAVGNDLAEHWEFAIRVEGRRNGIARRWIG